MDAHDHAEGRDTFSALSTARIDAPSSRKRHRVEHTNGSCAAPLRKTKAEEEQEEQEEEEEEEEEQEEEEASESKRTAHVPVLTAAAIPPPQPSYLLASWPATIPFVSWLIWDPCILISVILDKSQYTPWPGIEGHIEGEMLIPKELVATQPFAVGHVVGPVGGLLVPLQDASRISRQYRCPWLALPALRSQGRKGALLPALALVVTNEFSCCRGIASGSSSLSDALASGPRVGGSTSSASGGTTSDASTLSDGNITVAFLRDDVGSCYVAAVATRDILPYEELVFATAATSSL